MSDALKDLAPATTAERDRLREVNAEMVTMLRRVLDEYLIRDPSTGPVCALTLEQARAAIAKAEGGK